MTRDEIKATILEIEFLYQQAFDNYYERQSRQGKLFAEIIKLLKALEDRCIGS